MFQLIIIVNVSYLGKNVSYYRVFYVFFTIIFDII